MNHTSWSAGGRQMMFAVMLLAATHTWAASPKPPPQWTGLVDVFDGLVETDGVVGASVALVQDGRIVARHDYGFADKAAGKRVDGNTLFHWASISKTLNAISVMQLRDRGQLTLEDRVTGYVPELRRIHNPFGSMDAITLRMLMEHSAGFQMPTWPYKAGESWEPFEPTRWEQLVAMMPYQKIAFPPGSRVSYSNPTWIYLARILEAKTGDPWDSYIQKNIFAPLGMSRSYFRLTPYHLREHRSHHYVVRSGADGKPVTVDNGAEFDPGITVPNGGWNSPLADVAAYIGFLTDASGGDEQLEQRFDTVLQRPTVEEMWQPPRSVTAPLEDEYIGLAFFVRGRGEHRIIGHTGGQGGFNSMMYFNPITRRGVVAAFNTGNEITREEGQKSDYFRAIQQRVFELLR